MFWLRTFSSRVCILSGTTCASYGSQVTAQPLIPVSPWHESRVPELTLLVVSSIIIKTETETHSVPMRRALCAPPPLAPSSTGGQAEPRTWPGGLAPEP